MFPTSFRVNWPFSSGEEVTFDLRGSCKKFCHWVLLNQLLMHMKDDKLQMTNGAQRMTDTDLSQQLIRDRFFFLIFWVNCLQWSQVYECQNFLKVKLSM